MPVNFRPFLICAGLSVLAHLGLLGLEFGRQPPPPPEVSSRMEVGLISITRRPDFRPAQAPAGPPAPSPERPDPAPAEVSFSSQVPPPVAVSFEGETCRPAPPPPFPTPPDLPDPGREKTLASRTRFGSAALDPFRTAAPLYGENSPPAYPDQARRNGWSGEVLVRVAVADDGGVTATALELSSGYRVLDAAALAALRRWHFVPARRGDLAVTSEVLVPVRFRLADTAE